MLDTFPDWKFQHVLNSCKPTLQLSEIKKPIIILDLWATWCKACVQHFPKLDSLQNQFADSICILLVNNSATSKDEPAKVKLFVQKFLKDHPGFALPIVMDDSALLRYYFPVMYLPHYVWLNKDRQIIAFTGSEQITSATIERALLGWLPYPMKFDQYDLSPKH
jgi:thiol-disulfide isomerase/thioredoxin